ncbi:MAG: hypothetical protein ACE5OZ_04195 [Candidatus Heimdallarchaeota archaeon]
MRSWNGFVGSVIAVSVILDRPSLPGLLIGRFTFRDEIRAHHNELHPSPGGELPIVAAGLTRIAYLTLRWPGYVA